MQADSNNWKLSGILVLTIKEQQVIGPQQQVIKKQKRNGNMCLKTYDMSKEASFH